MQFVNGYDLIPEDTGKDMFVSGATEASDDSGWGMVLGWMTSKGWNYDGQPMVAALLSTNTDREKLMKLRDSLNVLLDEQDKRAHRGGGR